MKYIKLLSLGLLCLSLGGCRQDDQAPSNVQTGFYISLADADVQTETRSTPQELGKPAVDNFKLKIVNSASGKSIYDAGYTKDIIKASAGVYDVTASFGDNAVLAYDAPYYEGKKEDIVIEEGDTASVTVECAVANALVSVTFEDSDKFKELYSSYAVEVAVENSSLKLGDGDKRSAYYRADSKPTFTFKGVLKANGKSVEAELEDEKLSDPATFAAKAHCQLTLALKEMVPGIIPTIVKAEVDTVTVSATLPMEWLPAPKVSATDFGKNRTLDVYETAPTEASIVFTLSSPLQDMEFSVNFADENLKSLNGDYALSALTNEQRLDFINAGIDIPIIGEDKPSVRFSNTLTGALLATNEGVVNNTFTLKSVKANDRTNADGVLTYTIATHKPEFTVSVLPGNIWTKEFTVEEITVDEGKGNLEAIKKNLVYQYLENGEWKDCNNQASRQQVFSEHPSNRNYKVRALYRGALASNEVDVEMESQDQLENSDMENWFCADTDWEFPNYIPKVSSDASEFWDTNNEFTFRYNIPWPKDWYDSAYNGFPAVSYSTSYKHGGSRSAELRNTAAGPVGTASIIYDQNRVPGMLFYGNYTGTTSTGAANGNISVDEGRSFNMRPTQLSFWYTYEPYDGNGQDTYEVIVKVFDSLGNIIGEGSYTSNQQITDWTNETVDIVYGDKYVDKAAKIYVCFCSSNAGQGNVPYGKERDISLADSGNYTTHYGSILRIDDISLVYDK